MTSNTFVSDTGVPPTADQLQALGALTLEMFACDRLYWSRHFPIPMVNAIERIERGVS